VGSEAIVTAWNNWISLFKDLDENFRSSAEKNQ